MPRYRSNRMALRPIHRIKHVVDDNGLLAKATTKIIDVVQGKDAPVITDFIGVKTGAKVYGMYIKAVVASNDPIDTGVVPNVYFAVRKNPAHVLATPLLNSIGDSVDKRYILHQEMSMIENKGQGSNATVLFNGVVKIPKGFSRIGPDDRIEVILFSPALDIVTCIQVHYKEFQ